jgi:acyl-CoA thioester hydrolase
MGSTNGGTNLHRRRVGYAETDQGGVVHHAVYLEWLEQGRIEFLRERGVDVRRFEERAGLTLVVVEANVRYRSPARFDDVVTVETCADAVGAASLTFAYVVRRESPEAEGAQPSTDLATATVRVACIELATGRPKRFPESIRAALLST